MKTDKAYSKKLIFRVMVAMFQESCIAEEFMVEGFKTSQRLFNRLYVIIISKFYFVLCSFALMYLN